MQDPIRFSQRQANGDFKSYARFLINALHISFSSFRGPTESQLKLARNASKRKLQLGAYVCEWNEVSVACCPGTVA